MSADLNQLRERLKNQRNLSVTRDGKLVQSNRYNDAEMNNGEYNIPRVTATKLVPHRFAIS